MAGKVLEGRYFYDCRNNCGRLTSERGTLCVCCENGIKPGLLKGIKPPLVSNTFKVIGLLAILAAVVFLSTR